MTSPTNLKKQGWKWALRKGGKILGFTVDAGDAKQWEAEDAGEVIDLSKGKAIAPAASGVIELPKRDLQIHYCSINGVPNTRIAEWFGIGASRVSQIVAKTNRKVSLGHVAPLDGRCNTNTLSEILKISPRRIQQLTMDGHIKRIERGRYDLAQAMCGYLGFMETASEKTTKRKATMSDLRINDSDGKLREWIEGERKRLEAEGINLSFSQAAHRLIHLGQRSIEQTDSTHV